MPVLAVKQPLDQRKPILLVENKLAPGRHRFSLIVENEQGAASDPAFVVVTVRGGTTGPLGGVERPGLPPRRKQVKGQPS